MNTFAVLEDSWPSPFVARGQIEKFSGGLINARTLANLDSQGRGPEGRVKVGRKVAYPVKSVISWLESKLEGGR